MKSKIFLAALLLSVSSLFAQAKKQNHLPTKPFAKQPQNKMLEPDKQQKKNMPSPKLGKQVPQQNANVKQQKAPRSLHIKTPPAQARTTAIVCSNDSTHWQALDDSGVMQYYHSYPTTYDANGSVTTSMTYSLSGTTWVNYQKETYTYDSNGKETGYMQQTWNGTAWVTNYSQTNDANGNVLTSYSANYNGSTLTYSSQSTYSYNTAGQQTNYTNQDYSDDGFGNINSSTSTTTYTYNVSGNVTAQLQQNWSSMTTGGTTYTNSSASQTTYTYNAAGNATTKLGQDWNDLTSTWDNTYLTTYTYDAAGNVTVEFQQYWNGATWDNSSQTTYTYDANGHQTNFLEQIWDGGTSTWVNNSQNIYTYDAAGHQTSSLSQNWNSTTLTWESNFQYTTTYDAAGHQTGYSYQYGNGGVWTGGYKYTFTYDANGNLTSGIGQLWDGTAWENDWKSTYSLTLNGITLDANGNPITAGTAVYSSDSYAWNGTAWILVYSEQQYTSCANVLGLAENTIFSQVFMYPNPASTQFKIQGLPQASVINVLDITGKLLFTQKANDTNVVIETSNLNAGMYIIQIQSGNASATKKLMISK